MDWSSKLFLAILVPFVSVPVASIIKIVFSEENSKITFDTIKDNFDAMFFTASLFIVAGVIFTLRFRSDALNLYDYIEKTQEEKADKRNNADKFKRCFFRRSI